MSLYESFYRTFLAEMPWHVPSTNNFLTQLEMLQGAISVNSDVDQVTDGVFKIALGQQITFWAGTRDASNVMIIVDTEVNGNFCKVTLTSKNPSIPRGTPPYASDMYALIKHNLSKYNLVFSSDGIMSDDAIHLWKRLTKHGGSVSVFDTSKQQYSLTKVANPAVLSQYIGGVDKQRYIFVLSENDRFQRGIHHSFDIMELKRKALYPLFDEFKQNKPRI